MSAVKAFDGACNSLTSVPQLRREVLEGGAWGAWQEAYPPACPQNSALPQKQSQTPPTNAHCANTNRAYCECDNARRQTGDWLPTLHN